MKGEAMAKRRDNWREETKRIIRIYPRLLREENALRDTRITPNLSGAPGGAGVSRKTENTALRELSPGDQRALDAVRKAISTTGRYRNSKDRLKVIDLVYWKGTHDLHGAADQCHYSYESVQEWNAAFIELVDAYMRVP